MHWEIATAIAGFFLAIHPFDQPNVEAAKILARDMVATYQQQGSLPATEPTLVEGDLALYGDPGADSLQEALAAFLAAGRKGQSYIALQAYVHATADVAQHLAATIPGFGDPSKLNFRGAARAVQAANAFAGGAAPPAYGAPQGGSVYVAPQGAVTGVGSTTVIGAPAPGGAGSTIVVGGAAPPAAAVGVAPVTVTPTASAPRARWTACLF